MPVNSVELGREKKMLTIAIAMIWGGKLVTNEISKNKQIACLLAKLVWGSGTTHSCTLFADTYRYHTYIAFVILLCSYCN